jgi:CMP-N-acetylneuraminic acid synthetase
MAEGGVLAIVPARGGSRGIPGKNLARAGSRSLLGWAVAAAAESRHRPRVVVSTDSEEIAAAALQEGAEVPFLRPAELARDDTPGTAPVLHALRWLEQHEGYRPRWVVLLQPTSPLRTAADVDAALELAEARGADSVVSVTPAPVHPFWIKRLDEEGMLRDFAPVPEGITRRQDLPAAYALNGAVYVARRDVLLAEETFHTGRTLGYVMPPERSLDIDTPWELHVAGLVLSAAERDPAATTGTGG